ncbi:galactose mutarotase-like domain-containing protein [Cantharellus anzutake]|uniref:galactose mutarotase-like domain-containing protein n=1 Tax=Cantharellus anzutake TaxID=1750568 RepID=UPI0019067554|nr:galactose mutarotase-like domain-containing protein [Cantharellus anzutake]KAF8339793.1 galactose mutarotase-like domain-containing protein [Cantharellus anzutake]
MTDGLTQVVISPDEGSLFPPVSYEVLPYGFLLNKFITNPDGKTHDLVIGPHDIAEQYRRFLNPIIGRYSNRIPAGEHHIEKNDVRALVSAIANEGGKVSLHGGPEGFDRHAFTQLPSLSDSQLFTKEEITSITEKAGIGQEAAIFANTSAHGDQGFPGELYVEALFLTIPASKEWEPVTYRRSLGSLIINYRAILRAPDGSSTIISPVNLTQHWGFNLDASYAKAGESTPDVKDHNLYIQSSRILEGDSNLLPTGKLLDIRGGPFDFTGLDTTIGAKYPDPGYDHFWLFDEPHEPTHFAKSKLGSTDLITPLFAALPPKVRLSSKRSGFDFHVTTNQRGVQFYSGIGLDGSGTRKPIHGGSADGVGYTQATAAFLEFHAPHSAFLHKFGDPAQAKPGDDTILTSDELYNHWVRLDIWHTPNVGEEEP